MGISQSPRTVKDGLVFHFDAQNSKSYTGPVIANEFAVPTPAANGAVTFAIQGTGTFYRVPAGEVHGGYKVGADDVVYRYDLGGAGCHYHGNQTTMTAGQYATWQFDYYISKSITDFPTVNYLANMENVGAGTGGAVTVDAPTIGAAGNWRSIRHTVGPATATGLLRPLLYPGACSSSYLASAGYILYRNPAVWYTSFIPTANLPFVSGSRSNTQAIVDLTGQKTITAASLTYAANGSFSFNGTSDYLGITNTTLGNGNIPWTVSAWVKTTTNASTLGAGSVLSNQSGGPVYSMLGVNSGKIVYWTYQNNAWAQKLGVGTTVNDGNWHLLTWVNYSNYTMDMYVDGKLDSNVGNSTSGNQNPVDRIGGSWNGYFPGSIDALAIYNRALSAEEVAQNFNALRGRYGV